MHRYHFRASGLLAIALWLCSTTASAVLITSSDAVVIPVNTVGSGNGTLELRMMTHSGSEIANNHTGLPFNLNADNGNNTLPHNNSVASFAESYFTTAGEIQNFYRLNFPDGFGGSTVSELVLMFDLAENSGVEATNNLLTALDIISGPTVGALDPNGDLTSSQQAGINQSYTGGTVLANLAAPISLPTVATGQGHSDYAIFTGINPFTIVPSTPLLFNISMTGLSNGSEEVFLDKVLSGTDIMQAIPEASSFASFGVVTLLVGLAWSVRARR
jgi:hypothetical protein